MFLNKDFDLEVWTGLGETNFTQICPHVSTTKKQRTLVLPIYYWSKRNIESCVSLLLPFFY